MRWLGHIIIIMHDVFIYFCIVTHGSGIWLSASKTARIPLWLLPSWSHYIYCRSHRFTGSQWAYTSSTYSHKVTRRHRSVSHNKQLSSCSSSPFLLKSSDYVSTTADSSIHHHDSDPPSSYTHEVPVAVVEQRVSNLAQGSLCLVLLTGPFLHLLRLIPRGVLAGLLWVFPPFLKS